MIQAYPDRKVEVKFRIGEKTEGTGGGQNFDPHESTYPVPATFQIRVSNLKQGQRLWLANYFLLTLNRN